MDTVDDKKGLFTSLLYLRFEAKKLNMSCTEESLNTAIEAVIKDLSQNKETAEQLRDIQLFIDKALALPNSDLANLISLIDWFDESASH